MPDYNLPDFPLCPSYQTMDNDDWIIVSGDWFVQVAKFKNEYNEFYDWFKKIKVELAKGDGKCL